MKCFYCVPLENHREESAFENHLTAKILVVSSCFPLLLNHYLIKYRDSSLTGSPFFLQFTFFNNFAVLFHIAFFKQDVPLLRKVTYVLRILW